MRSRVCEAHDPYPGGRLFTADAAASWTLTELDPDDPDLAYGLCDLGLGAPKLDHVRLSLLAEVAGGAVSCDVDFVACQSLQSYLDASRNIGRIRPSPTTPQLRKYATPRFRQQASAHHPFPLRPTTVAEKP